MTIKEICQQYNIGQSALARRFGIPLRTVQQWYAGDRTPPAYVVNMIKEILEVKGMEYNYAVVVTYSFDAEVPVRLFKDYDEAKAYLKADWEKEVKIDTEENGWDADCEISDEGDYARITNHFDDRDDVTEWRIGVVNE